MKPLSSPLVLSLALVSPWSLAAASDPSLDGCWHAVKIVQFFKDGTKAQDVSGRCTLRFKDDQLESTCASTTGPVTSTYRYRIGRPHVYLATMTGSTYKTTLIGSTREYDYQVEGDRLTTSANLKPTEPPTPGMAIRVATEAARTACD